MSPKKRIRCAVIAGVILAVGAACLGMVLKDLMPWISWRSLQAPGPSTTIQHPSALLEEQVKKAIVEVISSQEAQALFSDVITEQFREHNDFRNVVVNSLASSPEFQQFVKKQIRDALDAPEFAELIRKALLTEPVEMLKEVLSRKDVQSYLQNMMMNAEKASGSNQTKR